jgi:hypothetical protein
MKKVKKGEKDYRQYITNVWKPEIFKRTGLLLIIQVALCDRCDKNTTCLKFARELFEQVERNIEVPMMSEGNRQSQQRLQTCQIILLYETFYPV